MPSDGFRDLRVVDADGTQVPWRTEPLPDAVPPRAVALVARGELDGVVSVVLDRGATADVIDRIELEVPDREFVGEVEVLGSSTGAEGSYAALSTTPIYAVRGAVAARSTTALFPSTDYRYLLVRARGVSRIDGATVARDPLQPRLDAVAATSSVRRRSRATVVTLDLGFPNVPVDAVEVQSSTDTFVRRAVVEGSNDGTTFVPLGSAEVARYRGVDLDRIPVDGRQRYVRVTIANGDDAPLSDLRVRALARDRPLLLAEGFTPPYRLLYGAPGLAAPAYDFAQLARGRDRPGSSARGAARLERSSTRTSSLRPTRARSSRETRTWSTASSSSRRSSPQSGASRAPPPRVRSLYVAARFDLRKSLPPPSASGGCDDSCLSGFFGFRSVGKILITA